jgi:hypothetical protein
VLKRTFVAGEVFYRPSPAFKAAAALTAALRPSNASMN